MSKRDPSGSEISTCGWLCGAGCRWIWCYAVVLTCSGIRKMCGIFCCVYPGKALCDVKYNSCVDMLKRRGPNGQDAVTIHCAPYYVLMASSVLWTQGNIPCIQPRRRGDHYLCWNGDLFEGSVAEKARSLGLSDTEVIFDRLVECDASNEPLTEILMNQHGPFSIIYFNAKKKTLWFGRDRIGRHSLLFNLEPLLKELVVSSVACAQMKVQEVPSVGLFKVVFGESGVESITLHPWSTVDSSYIDKISRDIGLKLDVRLNPRFIPPPKTLVVDMGTQLDVFYTPGLDTAKFISIITTSVPELNIYSRKLLNLLEAAVRLRIERKAPLCLDCAKGFDPIAFRRLCNHSRVALLFSGGIDSAIVAALVGKLLPPDESIDLLNVAFEKITHAPNSHKEGDKNGSSNTKEVYNVPDRQTGLSTLEELKVLFPSRKWNFVEINVSREELDEMRRKRISTLIYPLNTILDDSIGCALWFASRGIGCLNTRGVKYSSPATIVLTGMGADEQFGGYSRHRNVLNQYGWKSLEAEINTDVSRIATRNLGRDDRVIADNGRQVRLPFLDENVMKYAASLPIKSRCCPTKIMPKELGEKFLLRLIAWNLGLKKSAFLPKRAMQFGTRIANSRESGSNISERLC